LPVLTVQPPGARLEDAFWIDLLEPTPDEVEAVRAAVGLTAPTREQLSEIETSSRLRVAGQCLSLSTPILSKADTDEPELTPMGFLLNPKVLVTVRFARLRVVDAAATEAACVVNPTSVNVFTTLLEVIVDRAADLLEASGAELDGLSRQTFRGADAPRVNRANATLRKTLSQMGRLGDRLGQIRASLLGVGRLVPFASEMAKDWIGPEYQSRLGAVRVDVLSLADYESFLEGKNQFLLDAVLGFINTEQNDLFKILTIVSVVGVPPTLVASIYGMNFAYMPELHWKLGYPYAIAMIVLVTVLPMAWFKWKDWW
jgi:magnesium transporter